MARIMLCDDSSTILKILTAKLSVAGHEIVGSAKDGNEGVRVFQEIAPELLILDITMPNKDGRECLREILESNASAKIIVMSALSDGAVADECIKSGAKAFISKAHLYGSAECFKTEIVSVIQSVLKAA